MYFVYCLVSEKSPKFHYYGFTSNINQRIKYHQSGRVRTTNRFLPVKLLGYKTFNDRKSAITFEKAIKTKASFRKKFLKEHLQAHLPA